MRPPCPRRRQDRHPGRRPPLSLDQSVAQALGKNFSVRVQTYTVDQAKAGMIIAQSTYDPVLGVSWQQIVNKSDQEQFIASSTVPSRRPTRRPSFPRPTNRRPRCPPRRTSSPAAQVTANYIVVHATSNSPVSTFLNPTYRRHGLAERHPAPAPGRGHRLRARGHHHRPFRREDRRSELQKRRAYDDLQRGDRLFQPDLQPPAV